MTEQRKHEMREALQEAAIYVIATEGFDKATTKALARRAGINEGYIYRVFERKEDIFIRTFNILDGRLCATLMNNLVTIA